MHRRLMIYVVTAVVRVQSLAWELPHATGVSKKKKKRERERERESISTTID